MNDIDGNQRATCRKVDSAVCVFGWLAALAVFACSSGGRPASHTGSGGAAGHGGSPGTIVPHDAAATSSGGGGSPGVIRLPYLTGVKAIAASADSTCALLGDGNVDCWGERFGVGPAGIPTPIPGLTGVSAISMGGESVCALVNDGTVRCMGAVDSSVPGDAGMPIGGFLGIVVRTIEGISGAVAVYTSGAYACARISNGSVDCWGDPSRAIGRSTGGLPVVEVPELRGASDLYLTSISLCGKMPKRQADVPDSGPIDADDSGSTITCLHENALPGMSSPSFSYPGDSTLYTYIASGSAGSGDLVCSLRGMSIECSTADCSYPCSNPEWTFNPTISLGTVSNIAVGRAFACALLPDRTIECWGDNTLGTLGDGTVSGLWTNSTSRSSNVPTSVVGVKGAIFVVAADEHACALIADGTVKCWGLDLQGQLGTEDGVDAYVTSTPAEVLSDIPPPTCTDLRACCGQVSDTQACTFYAATSADAECALEFLKRNCQRINDAGSMGD
jgi:hypothetical protein